MSSGDGAGAAVLLHVSYDPRFLLLAYGVSILGAIAAVSLIEQHRSSRSVRNKRFLVFLNAVTAGAACVFSTHNVVMGGLRLSATRTVGGSRGQWVAIPQQHRAIYLVMSVLQVTVGYMVSFIIASRDKYYGTTKDDRVSIISSDIRRLVAGDSKHGLQSFGTTTESAKRMVMKRALFKDLHYIIMGGTTAGIASFATMILGLAAIEIQGYKTVHWGWMAPTCLVTLLGVIFMFWFWFRLLQWYPREEGYRTWGSLTAGALAVVLDALSGLCFRFMYVSSAPSVGSTQFSSSLVTGCASIIVSAFVICLAIYELRQKVVMYTEDVDELERLFREVFNADRHTDNNNNNHHPNQHLSNNASVMYMMARDRRDLAKLDSLLATTRCLIRKYRSQPLGRASRGGIGGAPASAAAGGGGSSKSSRRGGVKWWQFRRFIKDVLGLDNAEAGLVRLPVRSVAQVGTRRPLYHQHYYQNNNTSNVRMVRSQDNNTVLSHASDEDGPGVAYYQVIDFEGGGGGHHNHHQVGQHFSHSGGGGGRSSGHRPTSGESGGYHSHWSSSEQQQQQLSMSMTLTSAAGGGSGTGTGAGGAGGGAGGASGVGGGPALHPKLTFSKVEEGVALFAGFSTRGTAVAPLVVITSSGGSTSGTTASAAAAGAMPPLDQIDEEDCSPLNQSGVRITSVNMSQRSEGMLDESSQRLPDGEDIGGGEGGWGVRGSMSSSSAIDVRSGEEILPSSAQGGERDREEGDYKEEEEEGGAEAAEWKLPADDALEEEEATGEATDKQQQQQQPGSLLFRTLQQLSPRALQQQLSPRSLQQQVSPRSLQQQVSPRSRQQQLSPRPR